MRAYYRVKPKMLIYMLYISGPVYLLWTSCHIMQINDFLQFTMELGGTNSNQVDSLPLPLSPALPRIALQ